MNPGKAIALGCLAVALMGFAGMVVVLEAAEQSVR